MQHIETGGRILAFEVADTYTQYGLVGVLFLMGTAIEQLVMSCRVLGLDVEIAVLAAVAAHVGGGLSGRLIETDANMPIRDLWARAGFTPHDGVWRLAPGTGVPPPAHVALDSDIADQAVADVEPAPTVVAIEPPPPLPTPAPLAAPAPLAKVAALVTVPVAVSSPEPPQEPPEPSPPETSAPAYAPGSAWDVLTRPIATPHTAEGSRGSWLAGVLRRH